MAFPCSAVNCDQPGTLACSGCAEEPKARYSGPACQRGDWNRHRTTCAGAQKHNCFLIRATASNGGTNDADFIDPFPLQAYGNWGAEMRELQQRLGWRGADEAGKFYSHRNVNHWYYYAYASSQPNGLPRNNIASRCMGRQIFGDVAVVRSSPTDLDDYEEPFTRPELMKTLDFYHNKDPDDVFHERERTRLESRLGFPPGGVIGDPAYAVLRQVIWRNLLETCLKTRLVLPFGLTSQCTLVLDTAIPTIGPFTGCQLISPKHCDHA